MRADVWSVLHNRASLRALVNRVHLIVRLVRATSCSTDSEYPLADHLKSIADATAKLIIPVHRAIGLTRARLGERWGNGIVKASRQRRKCNREFVFFSSPFLFAFFINIRVASRICGKLIKNYRGTRVPLCSGKSSEITPRPTPIMTLVRKIINTTRISLLFPFFFLSSATGCSMYRQVRAEISVEWKRDSQSDALHRSCLLMEAHTFT